MKNVKETVIAIVEKLSGQKVKKTSQKLKDDLGIQSLHTVVLIVSLEEEFHIELCDNDLNPAHFTTVDSLIRIVEKYAGEGAD